MKKRIDSLKEKWKPLVVLMDDQKKHSPSPLYALTEMASELRGTIIDGFVFLEALMNNIIRKSIELNPDDPFFNLVDSLPDLKVKQKHFVIKHCMQEYIKNHGGSFEYLGDKLTMAIDLRNILAHWATDTTSEGIFLYAKEGILRFHKEKGKQSHDKTKEYSITMSKAADVLEIIDGAVRDLSIINNKLVRG